MRDRAVAFYSGGVDHRGRTLDRILAWPDEDLESVHDYIQWLFPTVQPSGVNPFAPLVTADTIETFERDQELRAHLRRALERMLSFYGLRLITDGSARVEIDDATFPVRSRNWLRPGNHNHLRLTRIMESLSALGLVSDARALQRCLLTDVYEGAGRNMISRDTYEYWTAAVPADR